MIQAWLILICDEIIYHIYICVGVYHMYICITRSFHGQEAVRPCQKATIMRSH